MASLQSHVMRCVMASTLAILFALPISAIAQEKNEFHQWASTPPMGWNSWDCFGPTVTEDEVKANTDYMATHLRSSGWEYIVVDIRWYVSNDKAHGYNEKDPQFNIDEFGRFTPAINRFPSAADGKGFKPLADYIHSKGLKFGIHIMRGIPVVAVKQKLPIKGTQVTAADIYSEKDQCLWLRDMYTIKPNVAGAQEYYNSIFELYASWGLDFVKIDDLSSPIYFEGEIDMIRKAIDRTGRKIVLSTSPGETPIAHADHVQKNANMWRTVGDFWDSWGQLKEHFDVFERWNKWRAPGAWPDGDMLPMGKIGIRAERGQPRFTKFTQDEQRTLMALWCMFRSPMMFGGNLPDNDAFTNELLTHPGLMKILKESKNNRQIMRNNDQAIWAADGPDGERYLAVFNIADQKFAEQERAIVNIALDRNASFKEVNVDINNAEKLYLVVTNGGDHIDWDHVDWINPVVYNGNDSLPLTKWKSASTGWGEIQPNKSISGGSLMVNGKTYGQGIGVHSNSIIEFDLPKGYKTFKALVGLDQAAVRQNTGATANCLVFTSDPRGSAPPKQAQIKIDLNQIGVKPGASVTNLWTGKSEGKLKPGFISTVPQHGCALYKIK